METTKLGIENLKKVIEVAVDMGNVADAIGHTSGITKWSHLMELLPDAIKLGTINFAQIKAEIKDLDAAERAELEQVIKDKLSIQDKALEAVIEEAIVVVEEYVAVVTHSIAFVKKIKAL